MDAVIAIVLIMALCFYMVSMFLPLPDVDYSRMLADIAIIDGLAVVPLEQRNAALMKVLLEIVENSTLTKEEAIEAYTTIVRNRVL